MLLPINSKLREEQRIFSLAQELLAERLRETLYIRKKWPILNATLVERLMLSTIGGKNYVH